MYDLWEKGTNGETNQTSCLEVYNWAFANSLQLLLLIFTWSRLKYFGKTSGWGGGGWGRVKVNPVILCYVLVLGDCHTCNNSVVLFSSRRESGALQLTERGPPVAPPATQIHETIVFFASAAQRWYCMSETFIIEMRHLRQWALGTWERPPRPPHLNATKGMKEMRFLQIIGARHLRFVTRHIMPISM